MSESLQKRYAPNSICFGCGPSNPKGLHIGSYELPERNGLAADWKPESHHEAFPGVLNGGIIGALLDCHGNWTAAWILMKNGGLDHPPCTVTAEFSVKLLRPTSSKHPLRVESEVLQTESDRAKISCKLESQGKVCATMEGLFVAVKPGHPAFHRWN